MLTIKKPIILLGGQNYKEVINLNIVENEIYEIVIDEKYNLLILNFHKYADKDTIKEFIEKICITIEKNKVVRLLFDASKFPIMSPDMQEWFLTRVNSFSPTHNLEKVAVVLPVDKAVQQNVFNKIHSKIEHQQEQRIFTNYDEAYKWISS